MMYGTNRTPGRHSRSLSGWVRSVMQSAFYSTGAYYWRVWSNCTYPLEFPCLIFLALIYLYLPFWGI
jgi:hypothetical protein